MTHGRARRAVAPLWRTSAGADPASTITGAVGTGTHARSSPVARARGARLGRCSVGIDPGSGITGMHEQRADRTMAQAGGKLSLRSSWAFILGDRPNKFPPLTSPCTPCSRGCCWYWTPPGPTCCVCARDYRVYCVDHVYGTSGAVVVPSSEGGCAHEAADRTRICVAVRGRAALGQAGYSGSVPANVRASFAPCHHCGTGCGS